MQLSKMHRNFALLLCCILFLAKTTFAANELRNLTDAIGDDGDEENEEIFTALLENWTLNNRNLPSRGREARVLQLESNIHQVEPPQFGGYHHPPQQQHQQQQQQPYQKYIPTNNMYLQKRVGMASEAELDPNRRLPPDDSILSRIQQQPQQSRPFNSPREVSETDLYLLGAIEKLAFRVDYLEKRLKRTEQIVYYLMQGNNQNQQQPLLQETSTTTQASTTTTTKKPARDLCPKDFKKVGDICYHLSSSERVDWKSAAMACKSYGAILAEFDKVEKFRDIVASILSHKAHRGHDFWIGGLNPGLLWIWSTSARPVNPNTNLTSFGGGHKKDVVNKIPVKVLNQAHQQNKTSTASPSTVSANFPDIIGDGRCLRLSYNPTIFSYGYTGHDCSAKQHYMCMIVDKTLDNEIKRLAKELNLQI